MSKVLILGANGQLARNTTRVFLKDAEAHLTLYLRRASRLTNPDPKRVTVVEGVPAAPLHVAIHPISTPLGSRACRQRGGVV
jgi:hypothetical protein